MIRSATARIFVLALTATLTAMSSALVIEHYGVKVFATAMILAGLQQFAPVLDLGIGGVLTNAARKLAGSGPQGGAEFGQALRQALKVQALVVLIALVGTITIIVLVGSFGSGPSLQLLMVGIALTLVYLNIPASDGFRILVGLGLPARATFAGGLAPMATAAYVAIAVAADIPQDAIYLAWPIGMITGSIACCLIARRSLRSFGRGHLDLEGPLAAPTPLRKVALPMAAISLAAPFTYSADRLVLGALSTPDEVAAFALVSQIYLPLYSVLYAMGLPLWGESNLAKLRRARLILVGSGLLAGTLLVIVGPIYAEVVAGDEVNADPVLYSLMGLLLLAHSLLIPSVMTNVTGRGLGINAGLAAVNALCTLSAAIALAPAFGAKGTVAACLVGLLLLHYLPLRFLSGRSPLHN